MVAVRAVVRSNATPADNTSRYLAEIGAEALLSAEEEITLSRKIHSGCARSRDRMISANLRLVVHIARNYLHQGLPLLDLVEEGNLGLIRAVDKFDPDRGCRFSTYAGYWIRQAIERGLINQGRTVRLPVHVARKVKKCASQAAQLRQSQSEPPSSQQIASAMGESPDAVETLLGFKNFKRISIVKSELGSVDVLDIVADENSEHPDHQCASEAARGQLMRWIRKLDKYQRRVVRMRFGLDGGGRKTLREVAATLGVSSERVRQIQLGAIASLRQISHEQGCDDLPILD